MDLPASVANKRLTARLSPLDATLTKNMGEGGSIGFSPHQLFQHFDGPAFFPHPSARNPRTTHCRSQHSISKGFQEMKKLANLFLAVLMIGTAVIAKDNPMVGGEQMIPTKDIVSNAVNS